MRWVRDWLGILEEWHRLRWHQAVVNVLKGQPKAHLETKRKVLISGSRSMSLKGEGSHQGLQVRIYPRVVPGREIHGHRSTENPSNIPDRFRKDRSRKMWHDRSVVRRVINQLLLGFE